MLKVPDVAERLGVSAKMIYKLVEQKKIAHYKIGGLLRFREIDIEAYVEGARVEVAAA